MNKEICRGDGEMVRKPATLKLTETGRLEDYTNEHNLGGKPGYFNMEADRR